MPKPDKDQYEKEEAERRFQQTLRGALNAPHKPHQSLKPKATTPEPKKPK